MKTDDNQTHLAGGDCQFPWQPSQQGTKNSMTHFQPVIHEPCHTCSPLMTEETHNIFRIIIQTETDQRLADQEHVEYTLSNLFCVIFRRVKSTLQRNSPIHKTRARARTSTTDEQATLNGLHSYCSVFNLQEPEFSFKFQHTLYLKCE